VSGNGGAATAAVAGSPYTITPSAATGGTFTTGNYAITYVPGNLSVSPAAVTVTARAQSKMYGQTLAFGGGSTLFTSSGLQNGETIGAVTLAVGGNGGAATAPVGGSPYTITPSAATGGTFTAGNYAITYAPGSLIINPAGLTVTASAQNKTYGQTLTFGGGSTLFASSGLQNGETIGTVTLAVSGNGGAATATVGGSPYAITPSAATGGTFAAGNYAITYVPGNLTVIPAGLTVTANNGSKMYGQSLTFAGTEFAVNGLQGGDSVGSVTLTSAGVANTAAPGSYPIVASVTTGSGLGNYSINYVNGFLRVNPALLLVMANNTNQVYGTTNPVLTATLTGFVNGDSVTNSDVGGEPELTTAANTNSPVGVYVITNTPGTLTSTNYVFAFTNGTLTVVPAAITVTANHQSQSYGAATPALTASYTGWVNGDTAAVLSGAPLLSVGVTTNSPVGSYVITAAAGTLGATNYVFTLVNGTLSVTPASLTITANAAVKTYGQTVAFGSGSPQFTSSGLQNGETIGTVTLAVSGNGGAATAAVGGSPYAITPSAAAGGTFTAGNYAITYVPGNLSVSPAALTVTAKGQSKTYGQTTAFGSGSTLFSSSGLQNGETIGTVTLAVGGNGGLATAPVGGSPYPITPSAATGGTFAAGNYVITYVPANLTVVPVALTVSARAQSKTYGQTVTFGSGSTLFTTSGLQNGETIGTVTLTVSHNGGCALATVAGSPYTITVNAATGGTFAAGNYAITYAPGSLSVSPAALTVTASAQSKTYGQTLTFGSGSTLFTSSGLQNGETIGTVTLAVSNNGGAAAAAVAGSPYTITPSAATGGTFIPANYAITYVAGSLTINAVVQAGTEITTGAQVIPVIISGPTLLRDGTVQLTFTGGNAGVNYEVQGSTDLRTWTTLTNNVAGTNGLPSFIDIGATNNAQRFYRTVAP
jgi:type II secretory pathway component PulC